MSFSISKICYSKRFVLHVDAHHLSNRNELKENTYYFTIILLNSSTTIFKKAHRMYCKSERLQSVGFHCKECKSRYIFFEYVYVIFTGVRHLCRSVLS